jgi:hypothetical protein
MVVAAVAVVVARLVRPPPDEIQSERDRYGLELRMAAELAEDGADVIATVASARSSRSAICLAPMPFASRSSTSRWRGLSWLSDARPDARDRRA